MANGNATARTWGSTLALAGVLGSFLPASATASGTPAGTQIRNVASISFLEGTTERSVASNEAAFRVDERIDVAIAWLDSGSVPVAPGDQGRVLSFRVVNSGNGPEAFRLSGNGTVAGDQWDPAIVGLAMDTNGNGLFDAGVDQAYRPGIDDPLLAPDAGVTVFVVTNIPTGLADASLGLGALRATATTGSGAPGLTFAGQGENGTDAVVGGTRATSTISGSLIASLVQPQLVKTQEVRDPNGGSSALPGAIITYRLVASYAGSIPNSGAVVDDPVPAGTTYVPGTLTLNGATLTDIADGDAGQASAAQIRVAIGSLSAAAPASVSFQVRVNN